MYEKYQEMWNKVFKHNPSSCRMNFEVLTCLYSNRYYHTLEHVNFCLNEFSEFKNNMSNCLYPHSIEFAIWYHDCIISKEKDFDNELYSYRFAAQVLKSMSVKLPEVKQLILATKHNTILTVENEQVIADIDLAVLGSNKFDKYEENIRKEYAEYDNYSYMNGRTKVLQSFLDKKQIYYTNYFRNKYESQARINLQTTIDKIKDQLSN